MNKMIKLFHQVIFVLMCTLLVFSYTIFSIPANAEVSQSAILIDTSINLTSMPFPKAYVQTRSEQIFVKASNNLVTQETQEEESGDVEEGDAIEEESGDVEEGDTIEEEWDPPLPSRTVEEGFWARVLGLSRRGSCSNLNPPLIALLPPLTSQARAVLAEGLESGLALTVSAYPTFWFYVPEQLGHIDFAEFMLQDERNEDVFTQPIKVQLKTSGIVSFELPSREDPLEVNKPYHWDFSVVCDPDRPSRNPNIDGWIERVQLKSRREQLAKATPRKRIEIYASKDIWHETLKLLAEQHCRYRKNPIYAEYWDTILQAVVRDVDRDKIDPLSYCFSKQQLQAVYDSLNIKDLGLTPVTD